MNTSIVEIEEGTPIDYFRCILAYLRSEYPKTRFMIKKISSSDSKEIRRVKS